MPFSAEVDSDIQFSTVSEGSVADAGLHSSITTNVKYEPWFLRCELTRRAHYFHKRNQASNNLIISSMHPSTMLEISSATVRRMCQGFLLEVCH